MPNFPYQVNVNNKSLFLAINEREFAKLTTFVDFSEGFTIGFIEVDKNPEKEWLISALIDLFKEQEVYFYTLNFDNSQLQFLLDEITEKLKYFNYQDHKKLVLIIEGLENSIGTFGSFPAVLQDLNFVRDAFTDNVPYPVLFCLPSYSITRLAKFAPDFWAWKSGVFKFKSLKYPLMTSPIFGKKRSIITKNP
ncbi:MAG TPA: hypothetical protein V6C58_26000 [Allocoleopsis sp.]